MEVSMKPSRGMRPQDLVVLLKIVSLKQRPWKTTDLAEQLSISQSEISQALTRNRTAGFLDDSKRGVHRHALLEFLIHGVRYVYPQKPGALVRGIPTAHSAPPLSTMIQANGSVYVWPDAEGNMRGEGIEPLYPTLPGAAKLDPELYELAALVDAIRVGKTRERDLAGRELNKRILVK
jgi:predicted transcriptional regulator